MFAPVAITAPAMAANTAALEVSIDSISPSVIPERGAIRVTGQVTNNSEDEWIDLNAYLLTSAEPFTTAEDLDAAAETDPTLEIGSRLTGAGQYAEIGDLAPGAIVNYALSVARKDLQLSGAPGVYWLGVHVLGANDDGRDSAADGRARSFMPLMDRNGPDTTMSLVVPIKNPVRRIADGSLKNLPGWQELLSSEGRLGRLMQLSGTAIDIPVTWVVDPAVLDAATSVAGDNPAMSIAPTDGQGTTPAPSESPSATPTDEPSGDPEQEPPELSEEALAAATWLDLFVRQSDQHTVLSAPYGDLDLAGVLRGDSKDLYERATDLSTLTMERLAVDASPVVAPPSGYLPNAVFAELDPQTPVILSDMAAPDADASLIENDLGHQIVLSDSTADDGGPGPTPPFDALAMRQRILSEAAIHALSGPQDQPLVVSMPQDWDPGVEWRFAQFFSGFDVPWLRTLDLPTATAVADPLTPTGTGYDGTLAYPRAERRAELSLANLLATEELRETGSVFANLLTRNDTVDEDLARSAMLASSYQARTHPHAAVVRARATTASVRSLMEQVSIDGPAFVTMSSEEGTFAVTIINELSEAVTVGIEAQTGTDELVIGSPEPVTLGAGQRATVRLKATSLNIGVNSVTLMATNSDGQPVGSATTFNVRSSQVGLVIWVIMGLGAAVLFTASGIRIVRRIRARNAAHHQVIEESAP